MLASHNRFTDNIVRARDLRALYVNLSAAAAPVLDLSDILRASIVIAVSAFDTLIHDLARIGMLESYMGARARTGAFGRFKIPLETVILAIASPGLTNWLEDEIRNQHSYLSFQQTDKVADAIRLISGKVLWREVGAILGITEETAKIRLKLIVDRRNQIAHEADMDPSSPGARWPIDEVLVQETIDNIEAIADAIYEVVTTP